MTVADSPHQLHIHTPIHTHSPASHDEGKLGVSILSVILRTALECYSQKNCRDNAYCSSTALAPAPSFWTWRHEVLLVIYWTLNLPMMSFTCCSALPHSGLTCTISFKDSPKFLVCGWHLSSISNGINVSLWMEGIGEVIGKVVKGARPICLVILKYVI